MATMLSVQYQKYEEQARKAEDSSAWSKLIAYVCLLLDEFAKEVPMPVVSREKPFRLSSSVPPSTELSQRELDVLRGIVKGLSTQEIAQQMIVAESTIKWHVKNIYSKLHVHNRVQAVTEARKLYLI